MDDAGQEVIIAGSEFDAVHLIEDELLLSLPNQVCTDPTCPERPERQFGDADDGEGAANQDNPFAVLEVLKERGRANDGQEQKI